MDDAPPPARPPDPSEPGRLTRDAAIALLQHAGDLLSSGDFAEAGQSFARVVGFDDPAITASALLGLGEAHYRLNDEAAALSSWQAVLQLPETPSTYTAWRNVAAARVREGDLRGAIDAYREADKRAPTEDKAEIANRLGWLTKETGDTRAAGRYFAKGRGDAPRVTLTLVIIALTSVVSLTTLLSPEASGLFDLFILDKAAVAAGEYWRLWTVTLLHADFLHLAFNMYALYLAGTIVERWYGSIRFGAIYLACAAAGSTASFVFGGDAPSVGASGAVFGLFGVLLAAGRLHHPVDPRSRGVVSQLLFLVVLNLVLGFSSGGSIDNAAHLGGLAAGLWLGALIPPTGVATMSSLWHKPGESRAAVGRATTPVYVFALGIAAVGVAVVAGVAVGTDQRSGVGVIAAPTVLADMTGLALAAVGISRRPATRRLRPRRRVVRAEAPRRPLRPRGNSDPRQGGPSTLIDATGRGPTRGPG
ncbi:MAG: rhomboid family intramembrane serine protease [Chloroflexota bacterium]